jgi:WD40 repeat protein
MHLAQQAWEAGTTEAARAILERHVPQPGQEDLRGFEWRYLWNLCRDGCRHTLRGHSRKVTAVAYSPDGRTVVAAAEDRTIRIWDVANWRAVQIVGYVSHSVAFAPAGETLAFAADSTKAVHFWDVASRRERPALRHATDVNAITYSPDGRLIAAGCSDGSVHLWDLAARRELAVLRGHTEPMCCVTFSRDGTMLASCGLDSTVRWWDVASQTAIATLRGHTTPVRSVSFSPDGKILASAGIDGSIRLWDTQSKRALAIWLVNTLS